MIKKNICVVTGTRADYGYLKLIIEKIEKSDKLNLILVVTGMHLLESHGNTIELIKKDKLPITKIIPMYKDNDATSISLGIAVGESIISFTKVFDELKPDLILILGDRYEPLAAAVSASTLKIPVAHIHGGDISGTVDEIIRHSITKLSHIHFPATPKSAERIKRMGEEEWRIYMVGSTSVDIAMAENLLEKKDLYDRYGLNSSEKLILCVQHPNVYESEKAGEQIKVTLQALKDMDLQTIIIYPNNDLGSDLIIKEIEGQKTNPKFKIFKNLERVFYLSLLKHADVLIGNSSGGLIESPIYHLPVVNIGTRNKDRERVENVIDADFEIQSIKNAIQKAISKEFKEQCLQIKNPYGDGKASDRILEVLEDIEISDNLLIKKLAYDIK